MQMVTRRNFFSICIMMLIILLLFQFSILGRNFFNNYDENIHLSETELTRDDAWSDQRANAGTQSILYIGNEDDPEVRIIRQWCEYTKRKFLRYDSLGDYTPPKNGAPALLCLPGKSVATPAQIEALSVMVQAGQNVLFCDLPESSLLMQLSPLRALLGIQTVAQEQVELTGIRLFPGFFLGGETIYLMEEEEEKANQEITLTAPWYLRRSGTKSYMVGLLEDDEVGNEDLPSLIWRNSHGLGRVFVVNGPYMQDEIGLGILGAVLYELQDYSLYPVVNAQNLSVTNFPILASENTQELMTIYERDLSRLQDSLMWPNLISTAEKGSYKMTNFLTPRLDYSVRDQLKDDDLIFYLKQFREQDAEAGVSFDHLPGISLTDKLAEDQAFFSSCSSAYSYGAAYVGSQELEAFMAAELQGSLRNIRTITGAWENADLFSYCTDTILAQSVTADGFIHTYLQDLRVKAIETALGYSNILLDMKRVSWPAKDDVHWEILSDNFSSNIITHWNPFAAFEKTTLSESNARVRSFLAVDYRDVRQADTIEVEITSGSSDNWFLLRTHAESIVDISGGNYTQVEEDVYLIHALEKNLQIELDARRDQ